MKIIIGEETKLKIDDEGFDSYGWVNVTRKILSSNVPTEVHIDDLYFAVKAFYDKHKALAKADNDKYKAGR